ncbi:beta-lactamase-like protein [Aspergillus pseudodeflectus]|uniref:Beta-lactamase-like protein n=1 Tax=Aspergillus pseudodeflectus TaxID=176178 RepID=A0ABR4JU78_9EURO
MAPQTASNPDEVLVIRNVTPNIVTLSLPFSPFGGVKFGGRGTLVRLATGSIAVFSPVPLTPRVHEAITNLGGQIKYIAALNIEHHLHLTAWKDAFPAAEIIAPEGLWEKRQAVAEFKDTAFTHIFRKDDQEPPKISSEFSAEFVVEYVHGHQSKELVFLHTPSRTLIEADLVLNLPATEQYSRTGESAASGLLNRLLKPLASTEMSAFWQKKYVWHVSAMADRKAFGASVRRIAAWEFNRIIPCHGDVIEGGGREVFCTVMERFLTAF